jgi:hypothetical protein
LRHFQGGYFPQTERCVNKQPTHGPILFCRAERKALRTIGRKILKI